MRLIDADELRKKVTSEYEDFIDIADFIEIVELRPTIEAEPIKHGHWKPFDLTWGRSVYSCTNCGTAMEVPRAMGELIYNYCPNCGAMMGEWEEPEINPCRGCTDYDGRGGCKSNGGCGAKMEVE